MEERKKLNLKELEKVSSGTLEEGYAYLEELCVKYGLDSGDYEPLDTMMTPEEMDTFTDLILHGII